MLMEIAETETNAEKSLALRADTLEPPLSMELSQEALSPESSQEMDSKSTEKENVTNSQNTIEELATLAASTSPL
jgi:hypothetical protein